MKFRLLLLAACLLYCTFSRAQLAVISPNTAAFKYSAKLQAGESYSPVAFSYGMRNHRHNRKWLIGGITGLSGCLLVYVGGAMWAIGDIQDTGPPNTGLQSAGIGVMVVGVAAGITGLIVGIQGIREDHGRYGWHFVAPKPNEIGIAYKF